MEGDGEVEEEDEAKREILRSVLKMRKQRRVKNEEKDSRKTDH